MYKTADMISKGEGFKPVLGDVNAFSYMINGTVLK